jgi:hypothetical protein
MTQSYPSASTPDPSVHYNDSDQVWNGRMSGTTATMHPSQDAAPMCGYASAIGLQREPYSRPTAFLMGFVGGLRHDGDIRMRLTQRRKHDDFVSDSSGVECGQ